VTRLLVVAIFGVVVSPSAVSAASAVPKRVCQADTAALVVGEEAFFAEHGRYGTAAELVGVYVRGRSRYHSISLGPEQASYTVKSIKGKGCSDHASYASPTTTVVTSPAGYHMVAVDGAQIRVFVPDAWITLGNTPDQIAAQIQALGSSLAPGTAASGTAAIMDLGSNLKFLAIGTGDSLGQSLTVATISFSGSFADEIDVGVSVFKQQFPTADVSKTTVAGVPAIKVSRSANVALANGGNLDVYVTQYFFQSTKGSGTAVLVQFTTARAGSTPTTDAMLQSIRFF